MMPESFILYMPQEWTWWQAGVMMMMMMMMIDDDDEAPMCVFAAGSQDSCVHVRPQGHGKRLCGVLPGVNGKPIVPFFIWGHEVMTSWCHDVRERHMASTWADQLSKLWELEQLPGARWGRRHGLLPGVLEEDEEGQAPFGIGYLGISWDDHGMWTLRSWLIFGEVWRISSVYLEYIYILYVRVCETRT